MTQKQKCYFFQVRKLRAENKALKAELDRAKITIRDLKSKNSSLVNNEKLLNEAREQYKKLDKTNDTCLKLNFEYQQNVMGFLESFRGKQSDYNTKF